MPSAKRDVTVALYMRMSALDRERYGVLWDEIAFARDPPRGLVLHLASEGVGAVNVCSVWESARDAERFVEQVLREALRRQGVAEPLSYRLEPVCDMVAP